MKSVFKKQFTLAAKFNILTIALIIATSLGITLFVIHQEITNNYSELLNRGMSMSAMMSQNSEYSIYTEDRKSLQQIADSIAADANVAYVAVLNAESRVLVSRTKDPSIRIPASLSGRTSDAAKRMSFGAHTDKTTGQRYVDILAPVVSIASADPLGLGMGTGLEQEAKTGPKTIGYVQLGLSQEGLRKRIRGFLLSTLLVTSLIVLLGVGVTVFLTRRIASPINRLVRVARDISEGKLEHMMDHDGTVEIAALAAAIHNMSSNLRDMLGKITGLASSVSRVTSAITESPASVMRVVDVQKKAIEEAARAITEVDANIASISTSSESLRASARDASTATGRLTDSVSGVAEHAGVFPVTARDAASSVEEMVASIKEIASSLESLSSSSEETSSALLEVNSTIKEIQQNAEESVKLAERVSADSSEKGMGAVKAAIQGMEHARESAGRLADAISSLGRRSEAIGAIISVIDGVAEQTSLLALNASILAAQAGQHGSSFAVVAGEVKGLAERTSASTREIAKLISSVQAEVKSSVKLAAEGTAAVDEGARLVMEVNAALQSIQKSAAVSTDMSRAIQKATVEEAKVIRGVTEAIRDQAKQIEFISRSTSEQTKGSRLIMAAIEKVKTVSSEVKTATADQLEGSKRITSVSENVSAQAAQITSAIKSQKQKSDEIVAFTDRIQKTTADLVASAAEMNRSVLALSSDAQKLMGELLKFRA